MKKSSLFITHEKNFFFKKKYEKEKYLVAYIESRLLHQ